MLLATCENERNAITRRERKNKLAKERMKASAKEESVVTAAVDITKRSRK